MSDSSSNEAMTSRRGFMRAGGATLAAGAAATAAGPASAQSDDYGGWLSNVGNYDGTVVDERGSDTVTIDVGAQGNGGPYAFGPPAVQVTPGTTIVWEWVEGYHNVVDEGGAFESEQTNEAGFTFEYTPEETGVIKYFCGPHRTMGMKAVLDVVEGSVSGGGGGASGGGEGSGGGNGQGSDPETAMGSSGDGGVGGLVVTALVLAFLSPALFAAFLRGRDVERGSGHEER